MQSFMSACIDFFGVLPGKGKLDFGREIKALTPEDRVEIAAGLEKNGMQIDPDTILPKA